jgi:type I restriction enzyme S subunit
VSNLRIPVLEALKVPTPPKALQMQIAAILGEIDDRIALLRETNATLEAIAQALFKSWFVDFDPVRASMHGSASDSTNTMKCDLFPGSLVESDLGAVPMGWQIATLGDAVDTVGGATPDTENPDFWEPAMHCWTTPKDLSRASAPVLLDTERKLSNHGLRRIGSGLLPPGSLLMSSRAPIGYLTMTQIPVAINQGYIGMLPGGALPPLYLLFWCRQNMDTIKGRANGSTFMEISKKAFRPIPVLIPPAPVLNAFVQVADALFARIVENEKQARTLTALRDTLLPRLISGKLLPAHITDEVSL